MAKPATLPHFRQVRPRFTNAARALAASCGVVVFASLVSPATAQDAPRAPVTLDALTPDTLDERTLDNLVAWARLHGYLQHFNPSAWAWTTNMFEYLRDGFGPAAQARTPQELATTLGGLARAVAPASLVWVSGEDRPPLPDLRAGARDKVTAVVAWRHEGYTPTISQEGPFFSRRVLYNLTAPEALKHGFAPDNPYQTDLPGGVRVLVPHANFVDQLGGILPNPAPRERVRKDWPNSWTYSTASERLAAVAFAWGLIQNFHPTVDRESIRWEAALRDAMREALAANDRASTTRVIQRMLARTRDAQADAWDPAQPVAGVPPLDVRVFGDALVVTRVDRSLAQSGIAPDDEIRSIDGVPANEALAEWRARRGGSSDEARDLRAALGALSGFPGSAISLEIRKPGGATRTVALSRSRPIFHAIDDGLAPIREVAPGIVYVDGGRVSDAELFENSDLAMEAPGIIFDLRSPYTQLGTTTLGWFTDHPGRASDQFIHVPIHPDVALVNVVDREARVMPNPTKMIGKGVFLVGPGTEGDAEFAALTVQDFKVGFVVGERTSGAPGRPAAATLPGGLEMQWTGLETRSIHGGAIFGSGVRPTIGASVTREDVRAGRDPALQRAIGALEEYFDSLD